MNSGTIIDGIYRYQLWRIWDESKPAAVFIMLNPSTADAHMDDPTLRRCVGFAKAWGYGGVKIVNLYALRSPYPKDLMAVSDPTGEFNDRHISEIVKQAGIIIAAWGSAGPTGTIKKTAIAKLDTAIGKSQVFCLGVTKSGDPKHPLYIKGDTKPQPFSCKYFLAG